MIAAILVMFCAVLVGTSASVTASALVALGLGVRVKEIVVTFGAPILRCRIGVTPVVFGWLPWGGSVSVDENQLREKSAINHCILNLSSILGVLLVSAICIRYDGAWTGFVTGFGHIIKGALSPLTEGKRLVEQYFGLAKTVSSVSLGGVVLAKLAAFNTLPIPPNAGARAIWSALGGYKNPRVFAVVSIVGLFVIYAILGSWALAVGAAVLRIGG